MKIVPGTLAIQVADSLWLEFYPARTCTWPRTSFSGAGELFLLLGKVSNRDFFNSVVFLRLRTMETCCLESSDFIKYTQTLGER